MAGSVCRYLWIAADFSSRGFKRGSFNTDHEGVSVTHVYAFKWISVCIQYTKSMGQLCCMYISIWINAINISRSPVFHGLQESGFPVSWLCAPPSGRSRECVAVHSPRLWGVSVSWLSGPLITAARGGVFKPTLYSCALYIAAKL